MGLIFKDTIFLKETSDLETELVELEKLKGKVKDKEKLDKYIKTLKAGINGEKAIEYELKNARIGMYVLHDINVVYEDNNAQIDYVIITPAHCYLVECKNMIGDITVDNKGQFVRKLPWGSKESIYSPLTQAQRHVDVIKKIRDKNNGLIAKAVISLSNDDYYKPLVVVSNSNGILNTRFATKEVKNKIVRVDALIEYLNNDIQNKKLIELDSKSVMEKIAYKLLEHNTQKEKNNWLERFEIAEDINESNDSELKERLLTYRKEQSKQRNYPAYYIFTNDQLDKLLEIKPKDKNELSKILEPVKVKIYGEDIIKFFSDI